MRYTAKSSLNDVLALDCRLHQEIEASRSCAAGAGESGVHIWLHTRLLRFLTGYCESRSYQLSFSLALPLLPCFYIKIPFRYILNLPNVLENSAKQIDVLWIGSCCAELTR
jgi:hypothetical protein